MLPKILAGIVLAWKWLPEGLAVILLTVKLTLARSEILSLVVTVAATSLKLYYNNFFSKTLI